MSNHAALRKRIDHMLEAIEQRRSREQDAPRVAIYLPVKDNEPAIAREFRSGTGIIRFYVPESRKAA